VYQNLAKRCVFINCALCDRFRHRWYALYACALTAFMIAAQLLRDSATVFPNVNPSILTWLWKPLRNTLAGVLQFPTASAFDFLEFSLAPVPFS
jgi:hypothetical protein